ncbi:MAG: hypothetical protein QOH73_2314 [Gaiellaceae bacterium]|jgi:hypothetical protein|nr:hypothetical protein [Gaiellaceae bacterium]
MDIRITEPVYTDRLASFLESLGQTAIQCGPGQIDLILPDGEPERAVAISEIQIYLRVWGVLYPDAEIEAVEHDAPAGHAEPAREAETAVAS